jgi:hypothetical protein
LQRFVIILVCIIIGLPIKASAEVIPDWLNISKEPFVLSEPAGVINPILSADDVTDVAASFVADPFLFYEQGVWYMFFEVYNTDRGKGEIGLATSFDGLNWAYDRIVLSEDIHLSYPLVLKYQGQYYMIPETNILREVRLYRAASFPYGWTYHATIASGRRFVDPTIFFYADNWWMFVSNTTHDTLYLYYSKELTSGWIEHPMSPVIIGDASKARPGGRSFVFDRGRIMRIAQKDDILYGEQVRCFEVDVLTTNEYSEHEIFYSPLLFQSGTGWNKDGMHHFDPWWTGDRWLCATDGQNNGIWSIGVFETDVETSQGQNNNDQDDGGGGGGCFISIANKRHECQPQETIRPYIWAITVCFGIMSALKIWEKFFIRASVT